MALPGYDRKTIRSYFVLNDSLGNATIQFSNTREQQYLNPNIHTSPLYSAVSVSKAAYVRL